MPPVIGYTLRAGETGPLGDHGIEAVEWVAARASIWSGRAQCHGPAVVHLHAGVLSAGRGNTDWSGVSARVAQMGRMPSLGVTLSSDLQETAPESVLGSHLLSQVKQLQGQVGDVRLMLETGPRGGDELPVLSGTALVGALLEQTGCGWVLDVSRLLVQSRREGFDPYDAIAEVVPSATVVSLRVSPVVEDRKSGLLTLSETGLVPDAVWSLVRHSLVLAGHKTRSVCLAGRTARGGEKARQADVRHARFIIDRVQGRQRMLRQQPA